MQSPIRAILLLFFIAIPLLEIALLIKIGQLIGFWATILIVIGTAVLGTWLLHAQGIQTLRRVMSSMDEGKPPVGPVLEGLLLLIAGLLLLTPGIITDTIGFILLVPPVREIAVRYGLRRLFVVNVGGRTWKEPDGMNDIGGSAGMDNDDDARWRGSPKPRQGRAGAGEGPIIEGDYERLDERTIDPRDGKK